MAIKGRQNAISKGKNLKRFKMVTKDGDLQVVGWISGCSVRWGRHDVCSCCCAFEWSKRGIKFVITVCTLRPFATTWSGRLRLDSADYRLFLLSFSPLLLLFQTHSHTHTHSHSRTDRQIDLKITNHNVWSTQKILFTKKKKKWKTILKNVNIGEEEGGEHFHSEKNCQRNSNRTLMLLLFRVKERKERE